MTQEQIEKIRHLDECMRHNYRVQSQEVTDLYNKVLGKNVANTSCGSCIKRRIQELTTALNKWIEEHTAVVEGNVEKPKKTKKAKKEEEKDNGEQTPHIE